ncbi:MAG: carboxypeptidase regulatory-like domain-containing protein [Acidobacteriota bacterium]
MKPRLLIQSLASCLVVLLCSQELLIADIGGSISGSVKDPSGAAVVGAVVTLHNPDTGLTRQVNSDNTGAFEFLAVPAARNYVLEVEAAGFRKFIQPKLQLSVNQRLRADATLSLGEVTEAVTVEGSPVQVESINTQLGDVIDDRKMTALPLNGRSYIDLIGLQAGVVPITSSVARNDRFVSGNLGGGALAVNGNRETANSFMVNGGDVGEAKNNGASVAPSLDSIQEFRVLTNSFDAEYGRFSGSMVNVVTKSGTNSFHGVAYEFLRNDKLDARNFFDLNKTDIVTGKEIPNSARGVFKRNQFGFALGGPILKNRLFFFSDYQGTREVRGLTQGPIFVPSAAARSGDFSGANAAGFPELTGNVRGDNVSGNHTFDETLSARLGYPVKAGEPYWVPGCNTLTDAQAGMCVFPGQVIPQAAWSPVAKATVKFIPSPVGFRGGTPFFATTSEKRRLRDDKWGQRITLNDSRTGDWAFYYHYDNSTLRNPFGGGNLPGFPGNTPARAQQANVSNTRVFGPSAVNEVRLNYTRYALQTNLPEGQGLGKLSTFGFVTTGLGLISAIPEIEGLPTLSVGGAYGFSFGAARPVKQVNNSFQVADNFSKISGKHTLKFGGEGRYFQVNEYDSSIANGSFGFEGNETGNPFADYLLGAPDSFSQLSNTSFFTRAKYFSLFVQDSYKLKPNFTVNLGLRWEVSSPFYETRDWLNVISWGRESQKYPGSPTGWIFPGDHGLPRTVSPIHYGDFAPRLGIAYSPDFRDGLLAKITGGPGKTSIRIGGGLFRTAVEDQPAFWTIGDAPFGLYYATPTAIYLEEPYKDRRRGNDPGQRFPFIPPKPGDPIDWSTYLPIGGSPGVDPNNVVPYAMHFNLNLQREFPGAMILTVGYVGTRGRHLLLREESNPGSAARCLEITRILAAQGRTGEGCGPGGEDDVYDLNGDGLYTVGVDAFGTRPYSITSGRFAERGLLDFAGTNTYNSTIGNSAYDAMQVSLEKRAGALRVLGAYTWSKSFDDGSNYADDLINPFNHRISRSLSAFDLRHNFVASYSYELPFQRLTSRPVARKFLEGWQIAGITRFTTGLPITLSDSGDRTLAGTNGVDRPKYDGRPIEFFDPRKTDAHVYFSKAPFSRQDLGVAGNANRRFFAGPGLNNWDFSLSKTTRINERIRTEFRAEFFNAFNHAQFINPSGNVASAGFGRVTRARDPRIGQFSLKVHF